MATAPGSPDPAERSAALVRGHFLGGATAERLSDSAPNSGEGVEEEEPLEQAPTITRTETRDWLESWNEWSWASGRSDVGPLPSMQADDPGPQPEHAVRMNTDDNFFANRDAEYRMAHPVLNPPPAPPRVTFASEAEVREPPTPPGGQPQDELPPQERLQRTSTDDDFFALRDAEYRKAHPSAAQALSSMAAPPQGDLERSDTVDHFFDAREAAYRREHPGVPSRSPLVPPPVEPAPGAPPPPQPGLERTETADRFFEERDAANTARYTTLGPHTGQLPAAPANAAPLAQVPGVPAGMQVVMMPANAIPQMGGAPVAAMPGIPGMQGMMLMTPQGPLMAPPPTIAPPAQDLEPDRAAGPPPPYSSSVEALSPHAAAGGSADPGSLSVEAGAPPPMQPLQRSVSVNSHAFRVHWTVDAKKLKSTNQQIVSPAFELAFPGVMFKMLIKPSATGTAKGQAGFKKAKGKGYIELKCEGNINTQSAPVHFRLSVGDGAHLRGPVKCDFAERQIHGLPKGEDEWDFAEAVDPAKDTFMVCLEVMPVTQQYSAGPESNGSK